MLVTGGSGFMGSNFIRYLLNTDFSKTVINLDCLTYAGNIENLQDLQDDPRYHFVKGSILDMELLQQIYEQFHFLEIVHFAAETHVDRSIHGPKAFIDTNIYGTFTLLEFIRKHPEIKFHLISTDEVYGSLGHEGIFTENSPYQPSSPYSASKAASDHLTLAYAKTYDLNVTISHASNNYGPYQYPEKFIPHMLMNLMQNSPLPLYGSGQNVRDWLYVDDHSEAVLRILKLGKRSAVYNISSHSEKKNIDLLYDIIEIYAKLSSKDPKELYNLITYVQDRPGHDFRYAMDNTKTRLDLDWKPRYDIYKGLEATIIWYMQHAKWKNCRLHHSGATTI